MLCYRPIAGNAALLAAAATGSSEVAFELGKGASGDELEQAAAVAAEHGHESVSKMFKSRQGMLSSEL